MRIAALLLSLAFAQAASAQVVAGQDLSAITAAAQAAQQQAAQAAAVAASAQSAAAAACIATPSVPPMEVVGGGAGTNNGQCRPVNSTQPRITRVRPWTTDSTGKAAVTYQDIGTTDLGVILTQARTSATTVTPTCGYDPATLTRTGVTIVCTINVLNLGVLTIGTAPAGVAGSVTVLPNTPAS